jgi:CMP-N-acetylneuraminic acid synthetase
MSRLTLAVIPARGGSKGVPNKNIRDLAGRPLIAYTIEASKGSIMLTHTVVSTDSNEIASVAKSLGANVPFMRPSELATDLATSLPVIQHAIKEMEAIIECQFDAIVMLQPTCPLRTSADIDEAVNKLFDSGADSVISVVDVEGNHPLRMKRIVAGDRLINYIEQGSEDMRPRQVLPPTYIRNGALYVARRKVIMEEKTFVGEDCRALVMPSERSVNIDAFEDMLLAEHYLLSRKNK